MGDGVGGADLDGNAVDPLEGVSSSDRLNPAGGRIVGRGEGGGLGPVRSLGREVEGVEAEAESVQGDEDQAEEPCQHQGGHDAADRRGEVEGAGHQG